MNDNKCEFCKGTGKEPGEAGCVWCFSTGTKEGQKLLTPPAQQHQGEPVAWEVAARIADLPGVHEALKLFSEDPTGDAGTSLVREVLDASHADPGQVGRLREGISKHWKVVCDQRAELDALRAQLAAVTTLARDLTLKVHAEHGSTINDADCQSDLATLYAMAGTADPTPLEHCPGCGVYGYTGNCDKCIPH